MGKAINLTGQKFNRLVVIERATRDSHRAYWKCKCKCGREIEVLGQNLRNGNTKSCGCLQKEIVSKIRKGKLKEDLIGRQFGKLTVVKQDDSKKYRRPKWICKCECGESSIINRSDLVLGKRNSCGCLKRRKGIDNPRFDPTKTQKEREEKRNDGKSESWRIAVFERDKHTCKVCGDDKGGNLRSHHLDGYGWCKEGRFDVSNGITMCEDCHKKFHDKYGYGNNTKEQFIKEFGDVR